MKTGFVSLLVLALCIHAAAQRCDVLAYQQELLRNNPSLADKLKAAETFAIQHSSINPSARTEDNIIKIPVVVHILYHTPEEKALITDARVMQQLEILNKCFRRQHADSVNTPARFRALAADCNIEFQLATSTIRKASTTGILRKYTPISKWSMDDKMKFAASQGDDAWDAGSYLNIWVCNLDKFAGYASFPGGEAIKDGLVIDFDAFGITNTGNGYDLGKTAVHEIGHWLGLKHLWGDTNCGDDGVEDTPKQASYTSGCPSGIRITCSNGPDGDMYMNYMDFTNDGCTNLFTRGQRAKMRALFEQGGPRYSLLLSKGLNAPTVFEIPVAEEDPRWLRPQLYPNPANGVVNLDLSYDPRWVGKTLVVMNLQGQIVMQITISARLQQLDINKLPSGTYFLAAKKDDGESMKMQFIKM